MVLFEKDCTSFPQRKLRVWKIKIELKIGKPVETAMLSTGFLFCGKVRLLKHVENVETASVEKWVAGIVWVKLLFHKVLWKVQQPPLKREAIVGNHFCATSSVVMSKPSGGIRSLLSLSA